MVAFATGSNDVKSEDGVRPASIAALIANYFGFILPNLRNVYVVT